ncbi:MAG: cation-translocating P-type ATPase [Candidatus Omnitrophica bacterium]|nr:cation-translocating P-type ATPase [Candidatus Omnitrophota bacterium]
MAPEKEAGVDRRRSARLTGPGLTHQEAAARLAREGANELRPAKKRLPAAIFAAQFTDFMILILIAAAVVSVFIGELKDALAIFAIVLVNAVIGFAQEYRAEKAMEALKAMTSAKASVIRNGKTELIDSREVVRGDIVLLEAGRIVPADLKLVEEARLTVDESVLTGESMPVKKAAGEAVFKGTTITYGRGRGVVVSTGLKTEFGKIAEMIAEETDKKTPLQKRLADLGTKLTLAALLICAAIFVAGILRGESALSMFMIAISVAVAAIPEALPAVITISLALGAKKMAQKKVLIRRLTAVETLGSVTYVCADKTGTLTQNRMKARKIEPLDPENEKKLMLAAALSNDVTEDGKEKLVGDPTEIALLEASHEAGTSKKDLERDFPRIAEIPFDSDRKLMTTIHRKENGAISFTKGAAESIAKAVTGDSQRILAASEKMAEEGYRVIAFALREWERPPEVSAHQVESKLHFLGLIGLIDPPREEARESVALCRSAGVHPVMITGDHPVTAKAIAKTLGIWTGGLVMTGEELAALSEEQLKEKVEKIEVYARVSPEQKLKIVKALQERGQYVAMTGDGVNDAPALKRADIGVAMGTSGTDVAKETSAMILLDDNFGSIVRAIREGRKIYDNMRRFIRYAVTTNMSEILIIFAAPFLGLPITFLPIQILWINLLTDGLPGVALAAEKEEKNVMQRPPRPPKESVFAHGMGWHVVLVACLMAAITLTVQKMFSHLEEAHWRTLAFTSLCFCQLAHVLAIRSEKESLFSMGIFSNRPLFIAVSVTFLLQLTTIYAPFMNDIFYTTPLSAHELLIIGASASLVIIAVEIEKFFRRRLK